MDLAECWGRWWSGRGYCCGAIPLGDGAPGSWFGSTGGNTGGTRWEIPAECVCKVEVTQGHGADATKGHEELFKVG